MPIGIQICIHVCMYTCIYVYVSCIHRLGTHCPQLLSIAYVRGHIRKVVPLIAGLQYENGHIRTYHWAWMRACVAISYQYSLVLLLLVISYVGIVIRTTVIVILAVRSPPIILHISHHMLTTTATTGVTNMCTIIAMRNILTITCL